LKRRRIYRHMHTICIWRRREEEKKHCFCSEKKIYSMLVLFNVDVVVPFSNFNLFFLDLIILREGGREGGREEGRKGERKGGRKDEGRRQGRGEGRGGERGGHLERGGVTCDQIRNFGSTRLSFFVGLTRACHLRVQQC
jgi:hypothetical protein